MSSIPDRLVAALADRYRIERPLGEGGMATVFLAEDLKHERKVALKVLKPELAAVIGAERFVTEIKTTAAMQHPHILPLFDSGEADSFLYYVMPYIEGESLREKLVREKQLPIDEAVHIAEAVASALHYAHERGIVHRDIKPANILLHAGQPVVADFGIALAVSAAGGGRLTETGLSVGTPYYMSPEQATADRDVTARSDLYSLACVLYEMLAGDPPHSGSNAQAVLMRILTEDARPITDVRKSVPPNVRCVIEKGLEKLPADRFENAAEFARGLGDTAFRHRQLELSGTPAAAQGWDSGTGWGRWKLVAMAAIPALVVGAAMGRGWTLTSAVPAADAPVIRMPFDTTFQLEDAVALEISDDGSTLVYQVSNGVYIMELDGPTERLLPGTEGVNSVVFSPDGTEVVFGTSDGLYRTSVEGGPTIMMLERDDQPFPLDWLDDGSLIFASFDGTFLLPPDGEPASLLSSGLFLDFFGRAVPGGRWMLYSRRPLGATEDEGEVRLLDLETLESRTLLQGGFNPRYVTTGHIAFVRNDQSVLAVAFDREAGEITGRPFTVLDSLAVEEDIGFAPLAISTNGTLAYVTGPSNARTAGQTRIASLTPDGELGVLPIPPGRLSFSEVSPNGEHLAFARATELVVYEFSTGREVRLEMGFGGLPQWSRDGEAISFIRIGGGGGAPFSTAVWRWREGPSSIQIESPDLPVFISTDWTPDGRMIGQGGDQVDDEDIYIVDLDGTATEYLTATWGETQPTLSPGGRWVAYVSDESGTDEIYVRSLDQPDRRYDISAGPGNNPGWSPAGDLYFSRGDSLWIAELSLDPTPTVLDRRPLLGTEYPEGRVALFNRGIHPDGRIFVELDPLEEQEGDADEEEPEGPRVAWIVTNWFTELLERQGGNE